MFIDSILKWWVDRNRKPSDFNPAANRNYAPNLVQQEFIRLAAQKYWYLGFGDTDHSKPEISAFALNSVTVDVLEKAGKKQYFLEAGPENQYYFDFLRADEQEKRKHQIVQTVDIGRLSKSRDFIGGLWLESDDRLKLSDVFEQSARRVKDMRFVAADHRLPDHEYGVDVIKRVTSSYIRDQAWNLFQKKFPRLAGEEGGFLDRLARKFINHPIRETDFEAITDDIDTVKCIESYEGPAALMYGGGHYHAADNPGNDAFLGGLLTMGGKSLCVLDIFRDAAHEKEVERQSGHTSRAMAVLYVNPPKGRESGIKINNNALLPLFQQAMLNNQAGRMPQLRTAQFLPS